MTLSRIISDIMWFWQRKHPPLKANRAWRQADDAERRAIKRGCTQAIHKARKAKRDAIRRELSAFDPRSLEAGRG